MASVAVGAPSSRISQCTALQNRDRYIYIARDRHGPSLLPFPGCPLLEGLTNMAFDPKFTNVVHPQPSLEGPKSKRTK